MDKWFKLDKRLKLYMISMGSLMLIFVVLNLFCWDMFNSIENEKWDPSGKSHSGSHVHGSRRMFYHK